MTQLIQFTYLHPFVMGLLLVILFWLIVFLLQNRKKGGTIISYNNLLYPTIITFTLVLAFFYSHLILAIFFICIIWIILNTKNSLGKNPEEIKRIWKPIITIVSLIILAPWALLAVTWSWQLLAMGSDGCHSSGCFSLVSLIMYWFWIIPVPIFFLLAWVYSKKTKENR